MRDPRFVHPEPALHRALALWAAACAARVLPVFEAARSDDGRPRAALDAVAAWVDGALSVPEARAFSVAAHAAARDTTNPAARAAARAAGHAIATAHMADHAPHAAHYALDAVAIVDGGLAARDNERAWQRAHLDVALHALGFPERR
jgi:hypothetical protein